MDICLKNPENVKSQIKKASALLRVYQEDIQGDQEEIYQIEKLITDAETVLKQRHTNLSAAVEYWRRRDASAVGKDTIVQLQAQINLCENQQRQISKCRDEILNMRHGIASLKGKIDIYVERDKEVSLKTTQLIDKIVNAS